ncbi:MAG: TetR/AcrR family transcriptional regulator [Spirochaetes bacterium]|jgi:TetR/AcrR family transcriptional regulator|nr:TetR/AcrR family transcriptional regulator [Spirochaetota bacterium]
MDTKDQILQSAIECFTRFGFAKTTMSDIGKRVGMNKASLYYYFKDKEALYNDVIAKLRREHNSAVKIKLNAITKPDEKIIMLLKSEIDFTKSIAINYLSELQENEINPDETSAAYKLIVEESIILISKLLDAGKSSGYFKELDSHFTAELIISVARGLLLVDCPLSKPVQQRERAYDDVKERIEKSITLILKGLQL